MKSYARASALLVALCVSAAAFAEPVKISGVGSLECKVWLQSQRPEVELERRQWLLGFVTAHNFYATQQITPPNRDPSILTGYVQQYCQSNPEHRVVAAAVAYVRSKGGQSDSPAALK